MDHENIIITHTHTQHIYFPRKVFCRVDEIWPITSILIPILGGWSIKRHFGVIFHSKEREGEKLRMILILKCDGGGGGEEALKGRYDLCYTNCINNVDVDDRFITFKQEKNGKMLNTSVMRDCVLTQVI